MKKSNKRGSVFTLLLKNYILLTLILLLFLTGLFIGLLQKMNGIVAGIEPSQILEYNEVLEQERFNDFPIKQILGIKGGILIVDDQYQPIYQNGKALPVTSFDKNDIACISEYSLAPEIISKEMITADGQRQVSISILEKHEGKDIFRIYILDKDNTILYQPGDLPMDTLTAKQVRLLSDSFTPEYSIKKHSFVTTDGKTYTMLLFGNPARPETAEALERSVYDFILLCLLVYCLIIFVFVIFLKKKISKPLKLLCSELNHLENGESQHTSYRGPKEFVEIFDSFHSLSERLHQSEQERQKLELGRQKMLADISHDLRTPISVIQGYSKALHDGVIPHKQQSQYLEIIEQKAGNLNELINTFYEYSKMEHPDYVLNLVSEDICNTLRDYVADRYAELELAGFSVKVDIPETHIMCGIDTAAFRRALDNIVNNCIKHNQKGTTFSVCLTPYEKQVCIILSDNGAGIPAELRDTIFAPFVVGEASRSNYGSGLGLSIAKKIIEAHNGNITLLERELADGTAFEITLPIV
ncbi:MULTISPECIES: sensor histidine kinase [Bacillota]|uniref:histidine kinase n=2 Tax=Amedibacillus TaxID=2749846 RepID=A0A7G9GTA0_9FIRM|nr:MULTISPECIES: HAMP domain-containing sensor histidine kinase [Bacillota]QNM14032.1 HAMP domain-containing histidine kinase [[Eubacterium] hominis]MCH4285869.1 HAMP domain-containing histidine kinase [Amedibacillus hominis]RGB50208.1 sensor histidine kinase [Absiella sp. AM22-9]RGB56979.1 sensor histidine kinase [Absiella sp. AM10-20]RGC50726.1 sensor histidine kinase [Absiella sp. AM29-15]